MNYYLKMGLLPQDISAAHTEDTLQPADGVFSFTRRLHCQYHSVSKLLLLYPYNQKYNYF